MQIPNKDFKLKVGPYVYEVKYEEKLMEANRAHGLEDEQILEITINGKGVAQRQKQTFLHELLHACLGVSGLSYRLQSKEVVSEEDVVRSIAPTLLQVIEDNPKIFQTKKGKHTNA